MKDLTPLLNARSIAVVGASDKPSSFGGQVLSNLVEYGYDGTLFSVHPKHESLFSRPCYPSLSQAPEPPDCVALAVANHHLLNLLEEAGDEAAALEHYLAAADTEPAHPEVQVNLALLYEKLGEIDDATRSWRRYLQADPDGAWAQVARQRLVPHEV